MGYKELQMDQEERLCGACSGSGEGMYDGSRCHACSGRGVEPDYDDEYDAACERADRYNDALKTGDI